MEKFIETRYIADILSAKKELEGKDGNLIAKNLLSVESDYSDARSFLFSLGEDRLNEKYPPEDSKDWSEDRWRDENSSRCVKITEATLKIKVSELSAHLDELEATRRRIYGKN